jgi:hypothetical protein
MNINESSREFDAWIAEHVMGWKRTDTFLSRRSVGDLVPDANLQSFRLWEGSESEFLLGTRFVPHYTSSIADAWKVVDEMLAHNSDEVVVEYGWIGDNAWRCVFGQFDAEADTPALAICKAAYMVFVGDTEEERQ